MNVFTDFLPRTILFANQPNTALRNILAVAQQAVAMATSATGLATAAQAAATNAQNTASGAAVSASAAQATAASALTEAHSSVKTVGSQHPDGSGNVNLTVASLPISAGANVAISPTGVISATGDVTKVGGISPDGAGNVTLTRAAIPLTAGSNVAISEDGVVSTTGTVTKVLGVSPDSSGNVALTVAELPISAGAGISISPAGVIAATGPAAPATASTYNFVPIGTGPATLAHNGDGSVTLTSPDNGQGQFGVALANPGAPFTLQIVFTVTIRDPNFYTGIFMFAEVLGAATQSVAYLIAAHYTNVGNVYAGLGAANNPAQASTSSASSLAGFSGAAVASLGSPIPGTIALEMTRDATNITWKTSVDGGLNWSLECVVPNASLAAAGAAAPDTVGFGCWNQSASSINVTKFILTQP